MRKRMRVGISLSIETVERLDRVVARLPGANRSGLMEEILSLALPDLEDLAQLLEQARDPSGKLDEDAAREQLATWVGIRVLRMTAPDEGKETPG